MSMNTPTGGIIQTTAIKDFIELEDIDTQQYLLGINNITTGDGSKIKLEKILENSISTDTGNTLEIGSDNKLLNIEENTGVQAGTYAYPQNLVVNSKGKITSVVSGSPASVPIATTEQAGIVQPDGTSIVITEEGIISGQNTNNGLEIGDIGIAPLGIDETQGKRRYLNGQVITQDQHTGFTNKLKSAVQLYPSLACTEQEWQTTATLSVGGQVGKFVIDDVAGTIRLPKIIMPIQGLTNLASLAEIVQAGLPNITGTGIWGKQSEPTGAIYTTGTSNYGNTSSGNGEKFQGFDASLSNSIYGNSTTVQQEQIQYPYFIQVATGVEESVDVVREIELNNPFCLLDYKYSEYELDNISWLRSNGQWNAKAVFPDAYDLLLRIYNGTETKAGVSVKLSTETYADTDFVLNTSDETFRLPLKVALASGKAVIGNGMTLGLTNGTENFGLAQAPNDWNFATDGIGVSVGSSITASSTTNGKGVGVTADATKSGIELSDANLYLYFYVGETVQNANLINAGRIEEKLVNKADKIEVDGQWVNNYLELASAVTVPTSTNTEYDISSYLPNDTYDYEVMLTGYVTTGAGTGKFLNLLISTDKLTNFVRVCAAQTRTSTTVVTAGCASVPVSTGRKIIVNAYSGYDGTYTLVLVAYRRIGTNQ